MTTCSCFDVHSALKYYFKSLPSRLLNYCCLPIPLDYYLFFLFNPFDQQHTISFTLPSVLSWFLTLQLLMIKVTAPPPHSCVPEIDVSVAILMLHSKRCLKHKIVCCFEIFFCSLPGPAACDNTVRTVRSLRLLSTEHNKQETRWKKRKTVE